MRVYDPNSVEIEWLVRASRQTIEVRTPIPSLANTSTRRRWGTLASEKAHQQDSVRRALDVRGKRPTLPCIVRLTRVCSMRLDDDNVIGALKYVRDTVARWVHGIPETLPARRAGGQLKLTRRGHIATTRPRAPDGPGDGIVWQYGQDRARERYYQGVRIEITTTTEETTDHADLLTQ